MVGNAASTIAMINKCYYMMDYDLLCLDCILFNQGLYCGHVCLSEIESSCVEFYYCIIITLNLISYILLC